MDVTQVYNHAFQQGLAKADMFLYLLAATFVIEIATVAFLKRSDMLEHGYRYAHGVMNVAWYMRFFLVFLLLYVLKFGVYA